MGDGAATIDDPAKDMRFEDFVELAREAYIWGYPLVETGEYRRINIDKGIALNGMVVGREMMPDAYAPSMEVLYTMSELDLRDGPLVLEVPDHGERYYSFQFSDTFANVYRYVASRNCGSGPATCLVAGPHWQGATPEGMERIDSPSEDVLLTIRTGVAENDDIPAANAVIDEYGIGPLATFPGGQRAPITSPHPLYELYPILRFGYLGTGFFDRLCERMADEPLPEAERATAERFAAIGIGPGLRPVADGTEQARAGFAEAIKRGEQALETCDFATEVNGWKVIYGISERIADPCCGRSPRATVAVITPRRKRFTTTAARDRTAPR